MSKKLTYLLFGMFMFVCASTASAVNVEVNVGAYDGAWFYNGVRHTIGTETIDAPVGSNWIQVGDSGAGRIHFDVDSGGAVTSQNTVAASGGIETLAFNTVNVTVDPVNYKGMFSLMNVTRWPGITRYDARVAGIQNLALVPNLGYVLRIGERTTNHINVDVATDGTVTTDDSVATNGGAGMLTFNSVTIQVDPDLFGGTWSVGGVFGQLYNGSTYDGFINSISTRNNIGITPHENKSIVVVPGMIYDIIITVGNGGRKEIRVDQYGNITNNAINALTTSGDTIKFITKPVTVDPKQYLGIWSIGHGMAESSPIGERTFDLVPDTPYFIVFSSINNPAAGNNGSILIDMDAAGNFTSSWPTSVVASGNVLTLNNTTINFDAVDYTGQWNIGRSNGWVWFNGSQSIVLVPDWRYGIYLGSQSSPRWAFFAVDTNGNVTSERPESYTADGTNNTLLFNTVQIHVESGAYTDGISFIDVFTAPGDKVVVPGLDYRMFLAGGYRGSFTIESPCAVTNFPDVFTRTADDTTLDVSGFSLTCVAVEPPPPVNEPPFADAGGNVMITSAEQSVTTINGTVTDPDVGDVLTYRWLEGTTELQGSSSVNVDGSAPLSLASVFLLNGEHTLTLEAFDGIATVTDEMALIIGNSPPTIAPGGGGTYQIATDISLSGQVSDFDGDNLSYRWHEDGIDLYSGSIVTTAGGAQVDLPNLAIEGGLSLGEHTITLEVNDGSNDPVSADITVNVIDTTDPSISATASPGILWPPNHKMVDVVIQVNASDNGGDVTLTATAESSAPPGGDVVDISDLVIEQETGVITLQLRAERSGKGDGRTYTITVTATDDSGNSSDAVVTVVAPHDKGKK